MIIEQAAAEGQAFSFKKNPAVLSCGGMYLSRPKAQLPQRIVYHVLNLANQEEPTKIFTGRHHLLANILHQALAKEAMN